MYKKNSGYALVSPGYGGGGVPPGILTYQGGAYGKLAPVFPCRTVGYGPELDFHH
jgi:hypothetical protein